MTIDGRPAVLFRDGYAVTDDGRVWSFMRANGSLTGAFGAPVGGMSPDYTRPPRLRKGKDNGRGYLIVSLGRGKGGYAHRIVWEAWHGEHPGPRQVRHRDGIRSHNCIRNLVIGTQSDNEFDKHRHGTTPLADAHFNAKLTTDAVVKARQLFKAGVSVDRIKAQLSLTAGRQSIYGAVYGETWKSVDSIEPPAPKLGRWPNKENSK